MQGRHAPTTGRPTPSRRLVAGLTALGMGAGSLAIGLAVAGPAVAAPKPKADYHAGSDKAVFTVTGVEDSNCLISTGGNTVFIKPGDTIDFSTALAGLSLGGLNLQGGQVAGLNVKATIDGGSSKGGASLSVPAGKTVSVGNLSRGTHSLAWSASSVAVVIPAVVVLGRVVTPARDITLPLSSSQLKSGAKLSWKGDIYVTTSAPQCKIGVSTPHASVSVGPVHVSIGQHNVSVPGVKVPSKLPSVGNLTQHHGSSSSSTSSTHHATRTATNYKYVPPVMTVPEQVVPQGYGDGSGSGSGQGAYVSPDSGSGGSGGSGGGTSGTGTAAAAGKTLSVPQDSTGKNKTINLASDQPKSSTSGLPVVLAIVAVLALAMVAGMYARMFLLGRKS